ncbi:MAG: molybdenum cofactor biosynthesis protein MoaE [Acidimicrobiales bacterium]
MYGAYVEVAMTQLSAVAHELRGQWPSTGRVGLVERVGMVVPTDVTVMVAVPKSCKSEASTVRRSPARPRGHRPSCLRPVPQYVHASSARAAAAGVFVLAQLGTLWTTALAGTTAAGSGRKPT